MSDLRELITYIEIHPCDYPKRWKLAKKLYAGCEYRQALEHLQVLKREWTPRINVVRYLSATYYRLSRYDEALAELEEAITQWPDEIPLREQLARVLEVAGRKNEALGVWSAILTLDPNHSSALRMVAAAKESANRKGTAMDGQFVTAPLMPPSMSPDRLCPACGTPNSPDFERCWRCHAVLGLAEYPPMPLSRSDDSGGNRPELGDWPGWAVTLGWVFSLSMLLVSLGSLISFMEAARVAQTQGFRTTVELVSVSLINTRLAIAALLLLAWPTVFYLALAHVSRRPPPMLTTVTLGLLAAAATQAVLWAPIPVLWGVVVSLVCAVGLSFGVCRLGFGDSFVVLFAQLVCVVAVVVVALFLTTGPRFVMEIPRIAVHSKEYGGVGEKRLTGVVSPAQKHFEWRSTGSQWLDERAKRAVLEFRTQPVSPPVRVELRDAREIIEFKQLDTSPVAIAVNAAPGIPHLMVFQGDSTSGIEVTVRSLLEPVILD